MPDPTDTTPTTPTRGTTQMAQRLGITRSTLLSYRERFHLSKGIHFVQRGVGVKSPRYLWDPEAVERALGVSKQPKPRQTPSPSPMAEIVAHLLERRHQIKDVVAVDCLALAQLLIGQPPRKIPCDELREVMGSHTQNCLGNRLRRLRRAGLIECYPGTCGDPGYQLLRVGPVQL
jgi:hypothetical protein